MGKTPVKPTKKGSKTPAKKTPAKKTQMVAQMVDTVAVKRLEKAIHIQVMRRKTNLKMNPKRKILKRRRNQIPILRKSTSNVEKKAKRGRPLKNCPKRM